VKKVITVFVTALMVLLLVTSCEKGKSAASSGKTRVEFWGHVNESWNASHRDVIQKYNASQSEIEVVPTFFPYNEFEAKIQTSLMAGAAGADVYEIWGGWGLDFVASNALSEVPAALVSDLVNDCYEPVLGAFLSGNKYYGVPLEFNNEYGGMLVNKPRFQRLGISYPQTWDQIIDVARKTTERRGDIFDVRGLDFTTNDTLTTTWLSMILSKGGEYWVNGRLKFTTPEAREALQTLMNYIVVDRLTNLDSATGSEGIESWHFIGRDEAMMVPRGPWVIAELEAEYDKKIGVDFDFVSFPFWGPTKAFPAETGWSMCVPKSTKVADAAWKYITYFLEPSNLMQHNINCAQLPPRKSIKRDPAYLRQMPFMAPILEILDYSRFIGPFNTEVVKANLSQVFIALCTTNTYASIDAALTDLENQCNTELKL